MQYMVIKPHPVHRQVGVDADGTERVDLADAELFGSREQAQRVADQFGGRVASEAWIFPDAYEPYDDDDD